MEYEKLTAVIIFGVLFLIWSIVLVYTIITEKKIKKRETMAEFNEKVAEHGAIMVPKDYMPSVEYIGRTKKDKIEILAEKYIIASEALNKIAYPTLSGETDAKKIAQKALQEIGEVGK